MQDDVKSLGWSKVDIYVGMYLTCASCLSLAKHTYKHLCGKQSQEDKNRS